MNDQDAQLVAQALAGDAESFEKLYAVHARRVMAYLLRSGFKRSDADDLTQETFLRVHRALDSYDAERGRFSTWLSAIARNVARRQWGRRPQPESFDPAIAEASLAGVGNPSDGAAAREEVDAVRACIEDLPTELAAVVRLRYVQGRTTRGIGAITGLPESTVRLRLRQAQELLEKCLRAKGLVE